MKRFLCLVGMVLAIACPFFAFSSAALAQPDEDNKFLLLYFKEEDLIVESATRSRKSLTQVAENITVVTAEEIRLLNAHTVADVLNAVTGVQVFLTGGPGSLASLSIQGSENRHVAVFMDGIPLNNLGDNVADLGAIPVQNIEKIEIIKGSASSAWGSALGGVINIITKSGTGDDDRGGMASASFGQKNTQDLRIETSGKGDRIGYYLSAGKLRTDGFRPHNDFSGNNAYAKFSLDLGRSTTVTLSMSYDKSDRGIAEFPLYDLFINNDVKTVKSALSILTVPGKETTLSLTLWQLRQRYDVYNYQLSTGLESSKNAYKDTGFGTSAKLAWKHREHNVVLGADLDSKELESNSIAGTEQALRKSALYVNDTISINRFSITPGIRHDDTDTNGDITSPSLGMTYKPVDSVLLRAYGARGFSIPTLAATFGKNNLFSVANPELRMERVKSYQAGVETTALQFFWLKLGAFRHDVSDVITDSPGSPFMKVNGGKARRQGVEIELKSKPFHNASLLAGGAFMNTKNGTTGETMPDIPQKTYDLGLQYDMQSFKALLQGHYIYWNTEPTPFYEGKYNSMIFDLHVAKTFSLPQERMLEVFGAVHNIFNGDQYRMSFYKNPGRWMEGGLRYAF